MLQQTLNLVLLPSNVHTTANSNGQVHQPSWSFSSLFGREPIGQCVLAKSSNVSMALERTLIERLESSTKENTSNPFLLA